MTTTTDVAVREHGALAIESGQTRWTEMQEAAFGQLGIADAPEGDKGVFLHVSQRTGLDPFSKQIYMIPRYDYQAKKNKYTIQTGIEGFRVMRARAERLEGVRGILSRPVYYNAEGKEFPVWVSRGVPVAVEMTYTVRDRNGVETPYTSILRFDEYRQTRKETRDGVESQVLSGQWAVKPTHMLEKCTEADVYRKAFPQDFSGVQLDDAMPVPEPMPEQRQAPDAADLRQRAGTQTGTDWKGAVERGARRFAEQRATETTMTVTATVIPPDSSPAQAAPPAAAAPVAGAGEDPTRSPQASSPAGQDPSPEETPPPAVSSPSGSGTTRARTTARAQDGQIGTIQMHFKRLGYTDSTDDRVSRLSATGKLANYDGDLLTTSDLSAAQAAQVLLALGKCRDAQALTDLLDAGIKPEATDGE